VCVGDGASKHGQAGDTTIDISVHQMALCVKWRRWNVLLVNWGT